MRLTTLLFLLPAFLFAQNTPPAVTVINVQNDEQTKTLSITYDLTDSENEDCEVALFISENNGRTYSIFAGDATGDIGFPVAPGNAKTIDWQYDGKLSSDVNLRLKLVADDKYEISIENIIAKVDPDRLRGNLEFLEGVRHRTAGAAHLQAVKDSIENTFLNADLETASYSFMKGNYEAHNFLGTLQGSSEDNEYFLLGGHFDTVNDSPGADDNGSAIAGMMEAVAVMKDYNFEKTVKFIGFDLEESGLEGSAKFVGEDLSQDETLLGFLDFEMIGYYSDEPFSQTMPTGFDIFFPSVAAEMSADSFRGNFLTVVGNQVHEMLTDSFVSIAGDYVPELKTIKVTSPGAGIQVPDLLRSDHAPFWIGGHPALMLTDGANFRNPNYHSPNDLVSTLDFDFMKNVVKASIATIAKIAKPVHVGIATAPFSDVVDVSTPAVDFGIQIYPNPVEDFLHVNIETKKFHAQKLKLIALNGQAVRVENIAAGQVFGVSTAGLTPGIYFLQIIGSEGVVEKRVVVN